MKDIRPSTWIMLGVLVLIIFGPLFLLDMEPETPAANEPPAGPDKGIRPSNPFANEPAPQSPANNAPAKRADEPANTSGDGPVD